MKINYKTFIILAIIWIALGIGLFFYSPETKITDIFLICSIGMGICFAGYAIIKEKEKESKRQRKITEAQEIIADKIIKEHNKNKFNGS